MLAVVKKVRNVIVYGLAGLVILLAVLVGLFRLFLPRLPEYQDDIKSWATQAIGIEVDFAGMDARWRLSGPELNFYDAVLTLPGESAALIEAGEVTIGVGLVRLLVDRTLVVDRVLVAGSALEFSRDEDGQLRVQGLTPDELTAIVPSSGEAGDVLVEGRDLAVAYRLANGDTFDVDIESLEATRRDDNLALEATVDLDEGFGSRLVFSADRNGPPGSAVWQIFAEGRALSLARWSPLLPEAIAGIQSGFGDIDLWTELDGDGLSKATANLQLQDLAITGAANAGTFDIDGRLEVLRQDDGFVLAADNLSLVTASGRWPDAMLSAEWAQDADGALMTLRASASYLLLDDAGYFTPLMPEELRDVYSRYAPSGEIRELELSSADLDTDTRRFDLVALADGLGFAAIDRLPGLRGLSGSLRADTDGGRLELSSSGLAVEIPEYLDDVVTLDTATGTVIWRRSGDQLTVLTDRMEISNSFFESRSSLQMTIPAGDASPVVDLDSRWTIFDVVAAKRFIPRKVVPPALHRWFQRALLEGTLRDGRTRLTGALSDFPFDDGNGSFEVTALLEDGLLDYAPDWPAAAIESMDVYLDGLRLGTERNVANTMGNRTRNARVAIADLRDPVLTIDATGNGTLESIRQFALTSPIGNVFAGRLEDVSVDGAANFTLDLDFPIRDWRSYTFESRVEPRDGVISLAGFPAPVSELAGSVTVTRDSVASDELVGRFLGEPVSIDLRNAGEDEPEYSIIADASGTATAEGLVSQLRAPVDGLVIGRTTYSASVRFPRRGSEEPVPVHLAIDSNLEGLGLTLPEPLAKPADEPSRLALDIQFPGPGRIVASGALADRARWSADFYRDDYGWDFDRGSLAFGQDFPSSVPASRGLHVYGEVDRVRVSEWLAMSRPDAPAGRGVVERIRSIDLAVDHLWLFGQHLEGHSMRVDRSGSEWYVTAEGAHFEGTATIPYDLQGERPIVLDMDRLILPGDEEAEEQDGEISTLDPRNLPPVRITAREFAIGSRQVGSLDADFRKSDFGLQADSLQTEDPSFAIKGSAGWYWRSDGSGQSETMVDVTLTSRDVAETLTRLDYGPVIDGENMIIEADVRWPGGPRADFLGDLNGDVSVRLGEGQLNEVEPGAGRVFGLMSVVELPRRLALDFRDVFDKGFGFDEIKGNFRLDDGDAFTCDLSLEGPAADIGIVGRLGLEDGVYDQTAVVSANVGNTLPVVGAVVAGPQVAAALLIFSQIFKKPLQEMGQVYYGIEGDLDDPQVDGADADRFAATSEAARCLPDDE